MNLIDVKNLLFNYKIYSGEKEEVIEHTAIDHVSLSIKKGDFVGILGHNGSGKSTLAKQLAALLKPSGGIIYVNEWIRRKMNYFFLLGRQREWYFRTQIIS